MASVDSQATRSTLQSVDTTLSENITATQNYIPVVSTTNFSTSVVAEIESTNEVVSFTDISENRIGNSSTWSGAGWQPPLRQTRTSNAGTAPDGTNTAFSLVPDSSNNTHRQDIAPVVNGGLLNSTTYAISIFAKANGYTGLSIGLCATSNVAAINLPKTVYFNLTTGTVSFTGASIISSSVEDFGDGWYRCKIVGTTPASFDTSNPDRLLFGIGEDESTFSYVGNTTDGILLWGPQIEQKSTHSTYIPNDNVAPVYGLTGVTRGVNGTTAQAASSGDSIQQLPFAFQQVLGTVTSTLSEDIDATQNYVPVASTSGFVTGVDATIESTNEVVSFTDLSENLVEYSQDFNNSYWTKRKTTITANTSIAPDGTSTADTLTANANTNTFYNIKSDTAFTTGVNYTFSIHVKAGTYSFVSIGTSDTFSFSSFDISNGTIIVSNARASIEDKGNGWYRCNVKNLSPGGAQSVFIQFCDASGNTTLTLTGSETLLVWGAQMELGTNLEPPTTYLPTTSSALVGLTGVTRGVQGTTAQAASSGASVSQTPSLASLNTPIRLRGLSISPDGTGAARLTLCDNNGDSILDIDTPDGKVYTMNMPEAGLVFPNGVFVSNTENVTAYTLYTEKYSGPGLTAG